MEVNYDLAIVGGGPAGTAAAITAARSGLKTILFERGRFPRHKVCGEFVSAESHDLLLELLGTDHQLLRTPPAITRAKMFSDGRCVEFELASPGWSITRHDLDAALWEKAKACGVDCREGTVVDAIAANSVTIQGSTIPTKSTINAAGRWSNLRRATNIPSPRWIGLKAHFSGEHAPASTDIYFFEGGYCGVQPIGPNELNASAMVRSDVATTLEQVFAAHPELYQRSRAWNQNFNTLSTSPLIHEKPIPVSDGVVNAGDAAGFIDPFVGDGISLALRSGALAAQHAAEPGSYEREYMRRFGKIFATAALARKLVRAPELVRRFAIFSFRSEFLRTWALNRTRGI
ncbi:MAG TPA: FAD-dependent oxidoreductase [Terriglobales bacterium]|nr:FAD-dependent oxidoreductase [Terriglobales bacterium]